MNPTNDPIHEPEDEMEISLDSDLHSLLSTGRRLLASGDLLPWKLQDEIELVIRAIRGCALCHEMLGAVHGPACGSLRGQQVQRHDLALEPPVTGSKHETAPF